MAYSANKVILLADAYRGGESMLQLAHRFDMNYSAVRRALLGAGVKLRSAADGVRLARPRLGSGLRGKKRAPFSDATRKKMSEARKAAPAAGVSVKPSGYVEYTRGPHKGRSVHVVAMEQHLGRRLARGEVVHHIDGDKQNNHLDNLALMTRSAHTKLHRAERVGIRQ